MQKRPGEKKKKIILFDLFNIPVGRITFYYATLYQISFQPGPGWKTQDNGLWNNRPVLHAACETQSKGKSRNEKIFTLFVTRPCSSSTLCPFLSLLTAKRRKMILGIGGRLKKWMHECLENITRPGSGENHAESNDPTNKRGLPGHNNIGNSMTRSGFDVIWEIRADLYLLPNKRTLISELKITKEIQIIRLVYRYQTVYYE